MARVILTREDEERRHKWWEQQPVGSAIRAPEQLGASRPGIGIVSRQPMLPQPPEIEPVGGETAPTTIPPAPAPTAPLDALDVRTRPGVVAGRPTQGIMPVPQDAPIVAQPTAHGIVERPQQAAPVGGMTLAEMEQRGLSDLERQALGLPESPAATTSAGTSTPLTPEDRSALNYSIDELAAIQNIPDQLQLPGGGVAFRDSDGKYRVAHGANEEVAKQYGLQAADERGVPERTTMRQVQGLTSGQASVGLMDRPDRWSPNRSPAPLILKTPQQERAVMEASRSEAMRRHAVPFIDRPSGQQAIDQAEADRTRSRRWGQSGSNTQWERRQREMQRREDDTAQITAERERRATSEREARKFEASEAQKKRDSDERIAALNAAAKYPSDKREAGGKVTVEDARKALGDRLPFAQAYKQFLDTKPSDDDGGWFRSSSYEKAIKGIAEDFSMSVESVKLLGDALMEPLNDYYAALRQDGGSVAKPQETQGATQESGTVTDSQRKRIEGQVAAAAHSIRQDALREANGDTNQARQIYDRKVRELIERLQSEQE